MKMIISAAPVFVGHMDKNTIKSVILQLEQEHSSDCDSGKSLLKFIDYKPIDFIIPILRPVMVDSESELLY